MSTARIAWGIAGRSLRLIPRLPSTFVPSLVMPVVFVIVFSGGFAGLAELPRFPASNMVDWFLPMATLMGAGFAGITTGMGVARDLEIGFYDRFLASPAPRASLLMGAFTAAALRALLPLTLTLLVGVAMGASFADGPLAVAALAVAAVGIALVSSAWSVGIALRFKTLQAAPLMQVAFFLAMFLATAQMPLDLLTGWLREVAGINPMTQVLQLARQGFLGQVAWSTTWPGLATLGGALVALWAFAARSLHRVIP
ncbi:MAG: ABC transporter permease [Actinomycetota bacterium]|nr:ABC transporter permease [Actinomycetota bacterium]